MTLQPPSVDQDALTLGNIPHGSSKMVQQVISNRTQQPMLWRIDTCGTNWLSVDRKTGSLQPGEQQPINVTVDTNSLEAGSYIATLALISEGDDSSESVQVPVTLDISPKPNSKLVMANGAISTGSPLAVGLSFDQNLGSSETLPLSITNRDSQHAMKWTANTSGTSWVTLDRYEGTIQKNEQQTIYVTAYPRSLTHGDYTSTLTFTTEVSGVKSALQVHAGLHVHPIPYADNGPKTPIVIPNHLNFDTTQNNNFDMTEHNTTLTFTNPQPNGLVKWTLNTGGVNWVTLSKHADTLLPEKSETVTITINKASLPAGNPKTKLVLTIAFSDPEKASLEPTSVLIPITITAP